MASSDELVLLERVFLRIGAADSDEKLELSLNKFLPPVLLKLSSQQEDVRQKVMELLTHINKRVKTRPLVQLPVDSLLLQYQDPSASVFLINFTIIYIKMGFTRLPAQKQVDLIPSILNSLENKPLAHQESLLLLVVGAMQHIQWPSDPARRQAMYCLGDRPAIRRLLLQILLDVLLMPYGSNPVPPAPPSLSLYMYNKIVTDLGPSQTADQLEQCKLGVVKFLSSDAVSDGDCLGALVVGAADARFAVTNAAELQLRKIMGGIDWESPAVLAPLFSVYLGSKDGPADRQRDPASTRLRLKLLPYMCKARRQAILWPASIRVLFDSLYGQNTHTKLKAQALTFCSVIIQQVSAAQLSVVASVLLTSGLMKLIAESDSEPSLKQQAYLTAGQLVSKVPALVNRDLSLLQTLFTVLSQEQNADVRMSVREALLTMAAAFSVDLSDEGLLLALLTTQVEAPAPAARLVAVRYLTTVFPQTHSLSRLYLLIATGDSQDEVSGEAMKALYGAGYKVSGEGKADSAASVLYPDYMDMVAVVLEKASAREQNINTRLIVKNQVLAFNLTAYTQVITYLSLCLAEGSGVSTCGQRLQHPCEWTRAVTGRLRALHTSHSQLLHTYVSFIYKLVKADTGVVPVSCLLEYLGCVPDLLAGGYHKELPWIKRLLSDSREELREVSARLYASVVCAGPPAEVSDSLAQLAAALDLTSKDLETQHGVCLATGYTAERAVTRLAHVNSQLYEGPVRTLVTFLSHSHPLLVGAACTAVGEVARMVPLPLPDTAPDTAPALRLVCDRLLDNITSAKYTSKVKERSCRAAGMLCLSSSFPFRQDVIDFFLNNAKEIKDVEIQLSVGEALVCAVAGPQSSQCEDPWTGERAVTVASDQHQADPVCTALLQRLLSDILPLPHPHSRQSCCIWLLAILKHCGHLQSVKQQLMRLQSGFMDLLSENNDVVQDVASKGLALVYESGDAASQQALVGLLVTQLTEGRRAVGQVTADTRLFEEGSLGHAPTGGNLSTYKELCALASDLNQPDLIYKFMHLANHNAIWNSKKGAAFGFSTIAKAAGEQLSQHLPRILPRLYRYQFDPTPRIQQSMAAIWQALVPETNKTVELYHKEIFEDLINNLTSTQWRVRTSCCLALTDSLRVAASRLFQNCSHLLPSLWSQLFRVMDDVHEGTRHAASSTARTLSKLCVQWCEADKGKAGEAVVKTILPTILETGICHQVSDIRAISVQTVSQLVKSGGQLLRPHLPLLIPALLEAAGELEPLSLNYLSVRVANDRQTQDLVDTLRATAVKSHYTTDTVSKCVQYVDEDTFVAMLPRLQELLRGSLGLGTRVATAHTLVLLSHHLTVQQFQPHVGRLLSTLFSGLTDRNATIRRTCASAIGQLVHCAKDSSIDKLMDKLKNNYMEKEEEGLRTAVGLTLQAVARHHQDAIKARADVVIPLVFFAMHTAKNKDDPSSVSSWELWQDVWQEVSCGTEAALTRHLDTTLTLLHSVMQSPSWHVKAQAGRSIETLALKVGGSLEPDKQDTLVALLVGGLAGRTWDGKEQLLTALGSLCKHSKNVKGSASADTIVDALLRECAKDKVSYKSCALAALGDVLQALEVDRFQQVYGLVQDVLTKEVDSEENEKEEETSKRRQELLTLREVAFTTLGKAWPRTEETQAQFREQVVSQCVSCLENNTRPVQVKIMAAVLQYCDKLTLWERARLSDTDRAALHNITERIATALKYSLGISKHTQLRKEALNVLFLLGKNCRKINETAESKILETVFFDYLEELNKDNSPEIKSRVVDMKDFFNNTNQN